VAVWSRAIEVEQDADVPLVFGFASADPSGQLSLAVPYSFAATTDEFTASYTSDVTSPQLIQLTSTSGAITFGTATIGGASVGTISFTIPHASSVNFPQGTFYYDIIWKVGSINTYLMSGPFVVVPTVSR
jgi:hypothetical protein